MLLQSSDLRVDSLDGSAWGGGQANGSRVALQGTVDESKSHSVDITSCLSVGEGLIGSGLLKAV